MTVSATVFLIGAIQSRARVSFDTIDVRQINVRDSNGTLRLMLFGKDREPPIIMNRKVIGPRRSVPGAGLMFYNDSGDEIGGIDYGAQGDGQSQSLTFDAYKQDQVVQLWQAGTLADHSGGLVVNDVPSVPFEATNAAFAKWRSMPDGPARVAERMRLRGLGYAGATRLEVGTDSQKTARVVLNDREGRPRLRLSVNAEGMPAIEFLSADGKLLKTLSATP
jgi:hypothetical protein